MKRVMAGLLAMVMVLGLVSTVRAVEEGGEKAKPKRPDVRGVVVRVEGANVVLTVKVKAKEGEPQTQEQTVATNNQTQVSLNGQAATLASLEAGMHAAVWMENEVAVKIEAKSPPQKKQGDDKDGGKKKAE